MKACRAGTLSPAFIAGAGRFDPVEWVIHQAVVGTAHGDDIGMDSQRRGRHRVATPRRITIAMTGGRSEFHIGGPSAVLAGLRHAQASVRKTLKSPEKPKLFGAFKWSGREDSNLRPLPPEDSALPG